MFRTDCMSDAVTQSSLKKKNYQNKDSSENTYFLWSLAWLRWEMSFNSELFDLLSDFVS